MNAQLSTAALRQDAGHFSGERGLFPNGVAPQVTVTDADSGQVYAFRMIATRRSVEGLRFWEYACSGQPLSLTIYDA